MIKSSANENKLGFKLNMFILVALFSSLVPVISSQSQQCSFLIQVTSFACDDGWSIKLYDSWDWRTHKPSGKFAQAVNLKCGGLDSFNQLDAPCGDYCALELGFPPLRESNMVNIYVYQGPELLFAINPHIRRGDTHYELNQCPRKPAPGNEMITVGIYQQMLEIPESCTHNGDFKLIKIDCGPQCNNPPPPSHEGEECSYDIKIKTSCDPFSGNPFGKVSVSIADDIGIGGDGKRQLAGHLLSFKNLDNPGPDFITCMLAKFTIKGAPCIDFCGMKLTLEDTGVKWKVDYVEVSNKYVSHKFNIYQTLQPTHALIDGHDVATVISSQCVAPTAHSITVEGSVVWLPDKCDFTPNEYKDKVPGDKLAGWIYCNCTKAEGGSMALY